MRPVGQANECKMHFRIFALWPRSHDSNMKIFSFSRLCPAAMPLHAFAFLITFWAFGLLGLVFENDLTTSHSYSQSHQNVRQQAKPRQFHSLQIAF
jgi:hypothetical protein